MEKPSPEEIAAALALCRPLIEEWNYGRGYLEEPRHCEAGDALCRHINTLARILRASAQPAELSNNPGELPAPAAGEDEALFEHWDRARGAFSTLRGYTDWQIAGDCLAIRLRTVMNHLGEARAALAAEKESHARIIASWKAEECEWLARERGLEAERDHYRTGMNQAVARADVLQREAETHAQEARTQRATVYEIYQAVTGGTGEPGDWHGATPVVAKLAELRARAEAAEGDAASKRERITDLEVELEEAGDALTAAESLFAQAMAGAPSPRQIYELCLTIERIPASPEATAASVAASLLLPPGIRIDLGWDQDAAIRARAAGGE